MFKYILSIKNVYDYLILLFDISCLIFSRIMALTLGTILLQQKFTCCHNWCICSLMSPKFERVMHSLREPSSFKS